MGGPRAGGDVRGGAADGGRGAVALPRRAGPLEARARAAADAQAERLHAARLGAAARRIKRVAGEIERKGLTRHMKEVMA